MDYIKAVCDENQREVNKTSPYKKSPLKNLTIVSEEGDDDGPDPYALAMVGSEPLDIEMVDNGPEQRYDLNYLTQIEYNNDFIQSPSQDHYSSIMNKDESDSSQRVSILDNHFSNMFDSAYQFKTIESFHSSRERQSISTGHGSLTNAKLDLKEYLGTVRDLGTVNTSKLTSIVLK